MLTSDTRMLTTHVGSLPRPPALEKLLIARDRGQAIDQATFEREVSAGIDWVVDKQIESGVDIGNDGEESRVGFQTYVPQRMSGFGGESQRKMLTDMVKFPRYAEMFTERTWSTDQERPRVWNAPQAQTAVVYEPDLADVRFETKQFAASLERHAGPFVETFMTAASPGIVSTTMLRAEDNPDYPRDEDYVLALATELKKEYDHIIASGHLLQIDAPDLAMERQFMYQDRPLEEFLKRVELHIRALNIALADIPADKVRLHVCFGNWDGPHIDDCDLAPLLPLLYEAKVGALSIACSNPRHQHEWKVIKSNPPPAPMILIPGVIDVTTNYLEHPELVADRICLYAEVMGDKSRVIAGTDCGFSTFASYTFVAEDVCWAKLRTLADGAAIATERLWG
jgi:5-methyltetrahydropteroyltriglutamate--homocysteine methyltransferase